MPNANVTRLPAVLNERLLEIPDYQRPYAWGSKQLDDLWEDLDLLGGTGTHYAGTLVLRVVRTGDGTARTSVGDDGTTFTHCEVVDGQQRLTTCLLLLDRIRRRLELLPADAAPHAAAMAARLRGEFGVTSVDNVPRPRLELGGDLASYWRNQCLGDEAYVGPALIGGQQRLKDAAGFFDARLAEFAHEDPAIEFHRLKDLQSRVSSGLGFLVYEVDNAADVGMIFETLNERGRSLTELEKSKNYLLYLARTLPDGRAEELADLINQAWSEIFRNLTRLGVGVDPDEQLMRAHWLATQNPDVKSWQKIASINARFDRGRYVSGSTRVVPVEKELQDQESAWDQLHAEVSTYAKGLRDCSYFLAEMFDPTATFESFGEEAAPVRRRSAALRRSGVVAQYRPLLFAARLAHPTDGAFYGDLVQMCENYSARVFVIEQRRLNAGQARLFRLAYLLATGTDTATILDELASLLWGYAPDQQVRSSLLSTTENWYGRRGHKYFLYEYELSLHAHPQELRSYEEFIAHDQEQKTTEHILPQNPGPDAKGDCWRERFTEAQREELTNCLGNLVLTYDNSRYSNKCFDAKRGKHQQAGEQVSACYAQSELKQERELVQYADWTPESITARLAHLTDWALQRWAVPRPAHLAPVDVDELEAEDPDEMRVEAIGGDVHAV